MSGTRGRLLRVPMTQFQDAVWIALSRLLFGACVAWLTLLCLCDRAGPAGYVLSARFWLPLSRLTYTAYLMHPMVLSAFFAAFQAPLHFTVATGVAYYLNALALSYACAFVLALGVEFPCSGLDRVFAARR